MAAVSIAIAHGALGTKMSDYTIGTSAPGAGDVEVRFNTTDTNSKNISHHEVVVKLKEIIRQLETGGPSAINLMPLSGGAAPPPLV
jgi:hypothetical protein